MSSNPWAQWLRANGRRPFVMSTKAGWDAFPNAAPREPLTLLTRSEMGQLSPEELEDYNDARAVWHANPAAVRTTQVATAFFDHRPGDGRSTATATGCVARRSSTPSPPMGRRPSPLGTVGSFHHRIYRRYGPTTATGAQRLPVAYVPLPGETTLKGLNKQMLSFYRHPAATRSTKADLAGLVVDCVTTCETQLIIIDDLHFVDFGQRDGKAVSNHLKGLANAMPVTFMFTGVNLIKRRLFSEGADGPSEVAQMARRTTRCPVAPFTVSTDPGFRAWVDLLAALQGQLLLADAPDDVLTRHARELHRRTQGPIGSLTG